MTHSLTVMSSERISCLEQIIGFGPFILFVVLSVSKHGIIKKLPNVSVQMMDFDSRDQMAATLTSLWNKSARYLDDGETKWDLPRSRKVVSW